MNGPDVEGVLADLITDYLGSYTLPANYARPYVAHETHRDVAKRCGPLIAAHVAGALRAEVRAWLGSEADDNRAEGTRVGSMGHLIIADALAALAEQVGQVASVGEGEG